jgi:hypothetical protein
MVAAGSGSVLSLGNTEGRGEESGAQPREFDPLVPSAHRDFPEVTGKSPSTAISGSSFGDNVLGEKIESFEDRLRVDTSCGSDKVV